MTRSATDKIDLDAVDRIASRVGRTKDLAIPLLQAIQNEYRYLPAAALERLSKITGLDVADLVDTASFYTQFRMKPVGRHVIRVCHGTACHVRGAQTITDALRRHLEIPDGDDTDEKRLFTVEKVPCIGCCSLAPCMLIDEMTYGRLSPRSACGAIGKFLKEVRK